jgi:hypothetical protein
MSDQRLEPTAQHEILSAAPPAGPVAPAFVDAPAPQVLAALPAPAAELSAATLGPDEVAPELPTPCTQAQLRRFIKSRPYVPLHELRRRFGLNGADDDVSGVDVDGQRIFIGLPERETGLLGDLLRQGDVGYELLLDPTSPLVIGVFPMRPVQRP